LILNSAEEAVEAAKRSAEDAGGVIRKSNMMSLIPMISAAHRARICVIRGDHL
jgi:hypothetical protein